MWKIYARKSSKIKFVSELKNNYFLIIIFATVGYIALCIICIWQFQYYTVRMYNSYTNEHDDFKVVLFWNSFWGVKDWEIGYGNTALQRWGCKFTNCYFTSNKSLLNSSDAVLFHIQELTEKIPPLKSHGQKWIFFMLESPGYSRNLLYATDSWKYKFDWTMTYRLDSDMSLPYGMIAPKPKQQFMMEDEPMFTFEDKKWSMGENNSKRLVAIISSNCVTSSKRESYLKELQKYIPVDHYGRCGNLTCPKVLENGDSKCLDMLSKTYKFYLSFENSLCKDYITEKLYKILPLDVVPIVSGGADYHRIIPHKWYIDVRDFGSPKALAKYILYLNSHPDQYKKYFKDRKKYILKAYYGLRNLPAWCDLCAKLNQKTFKNSPTKIRDMSKWWGFHDCTL